MSECLLKWRLTIYHRSLKPRFWKEDTEPAARWRDACNGICGAMHCANEDPDSLPACVGFARTALRALGTREFWDRQ